METFDPDEVIADVESTRADRQERAVCALEWFRDRDGLLPRGEAGQQIAETHGWSEAAAQTAIGDVVSDLVDPVQQVNHPEQGKLVGIIEYHERPESGCYGYVDYDDVDGRRKRAVCSQCVIEADTDSEVAHATTGEGSTPSDAPWETLYATVVDHYENAHSVEPSEVEVGASLVSGTTVAGNTVFHAGNDGTGSGLNADVLRGVGPGDLGQDLRAPFSRGGDGVVTISSNQSAPTSPITATDFTVQSGVTLTLSQGNPLVVFATNSITVNGTIDGQGKGVKATSENGVPGYLPIDGRTSGDGGDGDRTAGGSGVGTKLSSEFASEYTTEYLWGKAPFVKPTPEVEFYPREKAIVPTHPWNQTAINGPELGIGHAGASGGLGESGDFINTSPGGGGAGGGGVVLASPSISIGGTIDLRGGDGGNGNNPGNGGTAAGGGGGGTGGAALLVFRSLSDNGTFRLAGGAGGSSGGSGAQDGEPGDSGDVYKISTDV